MRKVLAFVFINYLLCSCASVPATLRNAMRAHEKSFQHHAGLVVYDVTRQRTFDYNGNRYFTPASNTKILTLFSSLMLLGDSLRGIQYEYSGDSLIFWGTADPSFLNYKTNSSSAIYSFLTEQCRARKLYFSTANFNTTALGPGWAWDDYNDAYSAERSPFPIYGNLLRYRLTPDSLRMCPPLFSVVREKERSLHQAGLVRELATNTFRAYMPANADAIEEEVSLQMDARTTAMILSDTLHTVVDVVNRRPGKNAQYRKSVRADSVYAVMMKESDNFLAEQLLLQCAAALSDTLQPEIVINYIQQQYLNDLPDPLKWVDGSGLSRYNLFTPRSVVAVWKKLYAAVPKDRLFPMLAIGGEKGGTLSSYFRQDVPYVFGKTGTLSNNHCLSGFLVSKKGRIYIFSFMNSNYVRPTREVRLAMEKILNTLYTKG